jgi:hypothetical protein
MKEPVAVAEQKVVPEATSAVYQPELVRLYGVAITQISGGGFDTRGPLVNISVSPSATPAPPTAAPTAWQAALIYGYSFEGQCYSLPKPCVMVVRGAGAAAVGCGYNLPTPMGYMMWTADKLERTATISVEQGTIEDLVLQQNVGGKAPSAYGTRVQVAHRGGKLTE